MNTVVKNLFANIPLDLPEEVFDAMVTDSACRIERIVSKGQVSPAEGWYEQERNEWVIVLEGAAELLLEGEPALRLGKGDYVTIPAGRRHRVTWTDPERATVWLAVHY